MQKILTAQSLLFQNIEALGFSNDFQRICQQQKLATLEDIINLGHQQISGNRCFTIAWFDELMAFLHEQQLLYLLNH